MMNTQQPERKRRLTSHESLVDDDGYHSIVSERKNKRDVSSYIPVHNGRRYRGIGAMTLALLISILPAAKCEGFFTKMILANQRTVDQEDTVLQKDPITNKQQTSNRIVNPRRTSYAKFRKERPRRFGHAKRVEESISMQIIRERSLVEKTKGQVPTKETSEQYDLKGVSAENIEGELNEKATNSVDDNLSSVAMSSVFENEASGRENDGIANDQSLVVDGIEGTAAEESNGMNYLSPKGGSGKKDQTHQQNPDDKGQEVVEELVIGIDLDDTTMTADTFDHDLNNPVEKGKNGKAEDTSVPGHNLDTSGQQFLKEEAMVAQLDEAKIEEDEENPGIGRKGLLHGAKGFLDGVDISKTDLLALGTASALSTSAGMGGLAALLCVTQTLVACVTADDTEVITTRLVLVLTLPGEQAPTDDEYNELVEQANLFFSDILQNNYPDTFLSFEAFITSTLTTTDTTTNATGTRATNTMGQTDTNVLCEFKKESVSLIHGERVSTPKVVPSATEIDTIILNAPLETFIEDYLVPNLPETNSFRTATNGTIEVDRTRMPSASPSSPSAPSVSYAPSTAGIPTLGPGSAAPSAAAPTLSAAPSAAPTLSAAPSAAPTLSAAPSGAPSDASMSISSTLSLSISSTLSLQYFAGATDRDLTLAEYIELAQLMDSFYTAAFQANAPFSEDFLSYSTNVVSSTYNAGIIPQIELFFDADFTFQTGTAITSDQVRQSMENASYMSFVANYLLAPPTNQLDNVQVVSYSSTPTTNVQTTGVAGEATTSGLNTAPTSGASGAPTIGAPGAPTTVGATGELTSSRATTNAPTAAAALADAPDSFDFSDAVSLESNIPSSSTTNPAPNFISSQGFSPGNILMESPHTLDFSDDTDGDEVFLVSNMPSSTTTPNSQGFSPGSMPTPNAEDYSNPYYLTVISKSTSTLSPGVLDDLSTNTFAQHDFLMPSTEEEDKDEGRIKRQEKDKKKGE
jgi:hypothetical protein